MLTHRDFMWRNGSPIYVTDEDTDKEGNPKIAISSCDKCIEAAKKEGREERP